MSQITSTTTPVTLASIDKIHTFQVMETDLDRLEEVSSEVHAATSMLTFCGAILISILVSWVSQPGTVSTTWVGMHAGLGLASLLGTVAGAWGWYTKSKSRSKLSNRIRGK